MPPIPDFDSRITRPRLMVVGCGNPFATDDNVGPEFIHRLEARRPSGCEFRELWDGGLGLLDLFEKTESILLVDAVLSGATVGTVHLVPLPSAEVVPRAFAAVSSHAWGLEETLRLAKALHRGIPKLMLLGFELEHAAPGANRTPRVEDALQRVIERFPELQTALLDTTSELWSTSHSLF